MDQEATRLSAEDIVQLIHLLGRTPIEQFVREHAYLQRSLAGFSKRLPPDYAQRLARFLIQRSTLNQQGLQELLKRWRQQHQPLCDAIQQLEPPLTLESLAPLIQQHGGRATLYALRTDPRAEMLGDIISAIRQGLDQGEIPPAPSVALSTESASDVPKPNGSTTPARHSASPANTKERLAPAATVATLPRLTGSLASRTAPASAPKTTPDLFAALDAELQAIQATDQAIATCAAQLAQPQIAHDPQALQRIIEKLTSVRQKLIGSLDRFAALENSLLEKIRSETAEAEATGLAEGLTALLPQADTPLTVDDARAHLQALQHAHTRLQEAITLNERRRAALKAIPAAIESLLDEIAALGGEPGPLSARLAKLKATPGENISNRQLERTLEEARRYQAKALSQRNALLQGWHEDLQRACRDSETLLNQSLHLPTDLPEITNLQAVLDRVHALLATPLTPNPPVPLPFPPAQLASSHQALREHYERLRQALSNYNPQIALAALHDFESASPTDPTPQQLREVGAALVGAASLSEGYSSLIWRVGAMLLMTLDNAAAEQFYERYGYAAVATAITASLRAGDFPLGLTFAEKDYLFYTGADIASVFDHPRVQNILSDACASSTFPPVSADCFQHASPALRQAAGEFLRIAPHIHLPESLRLQLSAALLATASPEERSQAGRIFIHTLNNHGQNLNAYCAWRALAQESPDLYTDPLGLEILYRLFWRLTLDTHTPSAQLATLCADPVLGEISTYTPGIALALALGSLALARAHHPQGEALATHFLNLLHDHHPYPALSDALRARLPAHPGEAAGDTNEAHARQHAIQSALAQLASNLAEADRRIQISNYRFAPTKQMRNQIDTRLRPLLTTLQRGLQPTGDLAHKLSEMDPAELSRMLISEEERSRRQGGYEPIGGDDLNKLKRDLENLLSSLQIAARHQAELIALGLEPHSIEAALSSGSDYIPEHSLNETQANSQPWDNLEATQLELRRMLTEAPQARDMLQRALPNLPLDPA